MVITMLRNTILETERTADRGEGEREGESFRARKRM
jgi:hypothetical protein